MDPITASIVGALTAGAFKGLTEIGKTAIIDAYTKLKGLLSKKFGATSGVMRAIAELEPKPDSVPRQGVLEEELAAVNALQDAEVLAAAKHLYTQVQYQQQISLKSSVVQGSIVQVGRDQFQAGRDQFHIHADELVGSRTRRGARSVIGVLLIIGGLLMSIPAAGMLPFFDSDPTAPAGFHTSMHVMIFTIIGLGIVMVVGGVWLMRNMRKS